MEGRILNIHFALLPLFPGFGPLRQAISSGMRVAGVTIHVVDQLMDGGAILAQTACGLAPDDTEASLGRRLFEAAVPLLLQTVRMLANGELSLDGDRRPAWSPGTPAALTGAENPSVDGDLERFGGDSARRTADRALNQTTRMFGTKLFRWRRASGPALNRRSSTLTAPSNSPQSWGYVPYE